MTRSWRRALGHAGMRRPKPNALDHDNSLPSRLTLEVHREGDGWWIGAVELPGLFAAGHSVRELFDCLADATEQYTDGELPRSSKPAGDGRRASEDWQHPQWLARPPTAEEERWIVEWMMPVCKSPAYLSEVLVSWKVIDDMIRAAGIRTEPGAGVEDEDVVRALLARSARADRIAEIHSKWVGEGGLTSGECRECGEPWPCPTYDWARADSDRDAALSCWHREDEPPDEGGS